jgi:hypothetical protein
MNDDFKTPPFCAEDASYLPPDALGLGVEWYHLGRACTRRRSPTPGVSAAAPAASRGLATAYEESARSGAISSPSRILFARRAAPDSNRFLRRGRLRSPAQGLARPRSRLHAAGFRPGLRQLRELGVAAREDPELQRR